MKEIPDPIQNSAIKIIVDDREKNEDLLLVLRNAFGDGIDFQRLEVGDFLLPNLIVERKTFPDFCESIKDGRLFRQATLLSRSIIQPIIIIEGISADLTATQIRREAIQGALVTLSLIYRIPVLRSKSPEETARLILYASKQIENVGKSDHRFRRSKPGNNSIDQKLRMQLHILQGYPGIGPVRARKLIEKFGTLRNVLNSGENQLLQIPGLTKKIVTQLIELSN